MTWLVCPECGSENVERLKSHLVKLVRCRQPGCGYKAPISRFRVDEDEESPE